MKVLGLAVLGIVLVTLGCLDTQPPADTGVHLHADFALYINGEPFNFAQQKYMTDVNGNILSGIVHLHDLDGDVVHVHAPGVTLGMFLESLGMKLETKTSPEGIGQTITFTDDEGNTYTYSRFGCYNLEDGQAICVDPLITAQTWRLFVNGEQVPEDQVIEDYLIKDLDRIVLTNISYDGDLRSQLDGVTDKACIQSGKCPERGEPSPEDSCGGTECGVGNIPTA